jgi:hypothetical protein
VTQKVAEIRHRSYGNNSVICEQYSRALRKPVQSLTPQLTGSCQPVPLRGIRALARLMLFVCDTFGSKLLPVGAPVICLYPFSSHLSFLLEHYYGLSLGLSVNELLRFGSSTFNVHSLSFSRTKCRTNSLWGCALAVHTIDQNRIYTPVMANDTAAARAVT